MTTPMGFSHTAIYLPVGAPKTPENMYMDRWIFKTPWFAVRLHHIMKSDVDEAPHSHSWNFVGIILRGTYCEEIYSSPEAYESVFRKAWHPVWRDRKVFHKVKLFVDQYNRPKTVWTLCLAGPSRVNPDKKDIWFFWVRRPGTGNSMRIPWWEYGGDATAPA